MKKTALLALVVTALSGPSMARPDHHHRGHHRNHHAAVREAPVVSRSQITCDMVRAYVAQAGLVQARAMAQAAGMTAAEERRAMRCLENGA